VIKYVEQFHKNAEVMRDLATIPGRTVVFVERRGTCDGLCEYINDKGVNAVPLHGNREQELREDAIRKFKTGEVRVLVATSVAARGLDIPGIDHVINFDMPKNIDNYTHRIGRTGRAGKSGLATSYFNQSAKSIAPKLVRLLRSTQQDVPPWLADMAGERGRGGSGPRSRERSRDRDRDRDRDPRDRDRGYRDEWRGEGRFRGRG